MSRKNAIRVLSVLATVSIVSEYEGRFGILERLFGANLFDVSSVFALEFESRLTLDADR
jgi:hypothetical protein